MHSGRLLKMMRRAGDDQFSLIPGLYEFDRTHQFAGAFVDHVFYGLFDGNPGKLKRAANDISDDTPPPLNSGMMCISGRGRRLRPRGREEREDLRRLDIMAEKIDAFKEKIAGYTLERPERNHNKIT